jgi:hypothetical protein
MNVRKYCEDPDCRVCDGPLQETKREEDVAAEIARHELWLGTQGADYLFENGKGE